MPAQQLLGRRNAMKSRIRFRLAACLLICFPVLPGLAQTQRFVVPPLPPEAAQFDFLIGTWDIEVEPNIPNVSGKLHGRWTAEKAADGYMVTDEYRAFDDQGKTVYLGETYRVYNPQKKRWEFRYVEPYHGTWYEGTGQKKGAEMHLMQKGVQGNGKVSLLKIRIYNIRADHFSWSSLRSNDGGKTWTPGATIEARRVK
jgi:hypothetical protein